MSELAGAIRAGLRKNAVSDDASVMSAYMKGLQPFLGIKTPARSAVVRAALEAVPDEVQRWTAALDLWAGDFREERYAAQDILTASRLTLDDLPQLETMLGGADHWDALDSQIGLIGRLLSKHPDLRRKRVRVWRRSAHLWTRRAALLAQLPAKTDTDTALLRETVAAL